MKAAVNKVYGRPDVLEVIDIPKPTVEPNDVLVRVIASGVNRTDDGFLRAKPFVTRFFSGLTKPRHTVLGCEFSGEVVECGPLVTEFKVGDRVFGFDDVRWGGHAEYKAIDARKSITKIPEGISFKSAAVAGEGAHYALSYIQVMRKLGVKRVLVHGATGAIGSAAVQLMKHEGWYVAATSTTRMLDTVKKLGPDHVIDWQKSDFTSYGETFDLVFDSVGKSSLGACRNILKKRGIYIATEFGPHGQNPFLALASPIYKLFGAKRVLFPLPKNTKKLMEELSARLTDKSFVPLIDREYPLEDIRKAYEYVESGQKNGNVVLNIAKS